MDGQNSGASSSARSSIETQGYRATRGSVMPVGWRIEAQIVLATLATDRDLLEQPVRGGFRCAEICQDGSDEDWYQWAGRHGDRMLAQTNPGGLNLDSQFVARNVPRLQRFPGVAPRDCGTALPGWAGRPAQLDSPRDCAWQSGREHSGQPPISPLRPGSPAGAEQN